MIGQKDLLAVINDRIDADDFPRFCIITGAPGSGKKTIANYIAVNMCGYGVYHAPDVRVETIRNMITDSYKINSPMVYIISDVDNMSVASKNALLKVTEEPPHDAIFIMTVSNIETVLPTLRSRAYVYTMQPYTKDDIAEYAKGNPDLDIILELCENMGDVNKLNEIGAKALYEYVEKVVDNIADVNVANALKISEVIAFKDDGNKYDMNLFLRAFKSICGNRMKEAIYDDDIEMSLYYADGIKVVSSILSEINMTNLNKALLFDKFILDIRREWT